MPCTSVFNTVTVFFPLNRKEG